MMKRIKKLAKDKLKFTPLTARKAMYQGIVNYKHIPGLGGFNEKLLRCRRKISNRWNYTVHNPEFLTGANISVCLTKEFMEAVENDAEYELRFPDVEKYNRRGNESL